MEQTRWAVLGPGVISGFFARALRHSVHGVLHAVGSRDADRAARFAGEHGAAVSGTHAEVLARDDVDAVYIGTVHTTHAELATAALESGKAVLCEKPLTPTASETAALLDAAASARVPFLEAYKYRFGPLAEELRRVVADGVIGRPVHVEASFGGAAASRSGRLFDPTLAGGAILDVGCYPVSLAVGIATWAGIPGGSSPTVLAAAGRIGGTGVDEWTSATIDLGGVTAAVHTSIVHSQAPRVLIHGSAGTIDLPNVWGTRTESGTELEVRTVGEPRRVRLSSVDPMAAEADAISAALVHGQVEVPQVSWAESIRIAAICDAWRTALTAAQDR